MADQDPRNCLRQVALVLMDVHVPTGKWHSLEIKPQGRKLLRRSVGERFPVILGLPVFVELHGIVADGKLKLDADCPMIPFRKHNIQRFQSVSPCNPWQLSHWEANEVNAAERPRGMHPGAAQPCGYR